MLKNERSLVLAANPMEAAELKTVFSGDSESIRRKLENPPRLREHGWGLQTLDHAKFMKGELIRVASGRMVIDLYRDGNLLLVGKVDRNFLAWSNKEDLQMHPLALIELAVNFTRFYQCVIDDFRTRPEQIEFRVELRNMHLNKQKTRLGSGPVGKFWPLGMGGLEAPSDTWRREILVSSGAYNAEKVAFLLIRELYLWFGHSEEAIPYTKDTADGKEIDAAQIVQI